MSENDIFVFGSKIFPIVERDPISSLPLELSWKIFSYLEDDLALRLVSRVCRSWHRIILSCSRLRKRLNKFELVMRLGSESLAKYYRRIRKRRRKEKKKNFVPTQRCIEQPSSTSTIQKRKADEIIIFTKRYKLC